MLARDTFHLPPILREVWRPLAGPLPLDVPVTTGMVPDLNILTPIGSAVIGFVFPALGEEDGPAPVRPVWGVLR